MSNNRPPIAEKVKFWEEQDKINQSFIPRVIEMNDSLQKLSKQSLKHNSKTIDLTSRVDVLEMIIKDLKTQIQEQSDKKVNAIEVDGDKYHNQTMLAIIVAVVALIISIVSFSR